MELTLNNPDEIRHLKDALVSQILQDFNPSAIPSEDRNQAVIDIILERFRGLRATLPRDIRDSFFHDVINEVLGFGVLQPLIDDPDVTEIIVNGKDSVIIEKNGQRAQIDIHFQTNEELVQLIHRSAERLGLQIDPNNPTLDGRFHGNSRINVILPPVAIDSPILTIQKFSRCKLSIKELIDSEMLSQNIASFIRACIASRLNLLITGLEDSGKTTLLNAIASFIPPGERIITIEDVPELNLNHRNVLRLESKLPSLENKSGISPSDLIHLALRTRPDRLIIGDIRGGESMALLQAMNSGTNGALATLHANSSSDAVSRLDTLCLLTGNNVTPRIVHEQIASALDIIIHLSRLKNGSRHIVTITEVSGMESENVILTDIFRYEQTGIDQNGNILGDLKPTGIRPLFTARLEANGYKLSPEIFGANLSELFQG